MENTWTTDDLGIQRFYHDGWTITVMPNDKIHPYIDAPDPDIEVNVSSTGIQCFGEKNLGHWNGHVGVRYTIPWRIIQEVMSYVELTSTFRTEEQFNFDPFARNPQLIDNSIASFLGK